MPEQSTVSKVRRSLDKELPKVDFDSAVVEYFAGSLEGDEPLSEDKLAEEWSPLLISVGAAADDDEARSVCRGLLARLRSEDGSTTASDGGGSCGGGGQAPAARKDDSPQAAAAVEEAISKELEEWLEKLRLSQYAEQARDWCERMGAAHLQEVIDNWQDFASELKLKPLERKRVEKAVAGGDASGPGRPAQQAQPRPAQAPVSGVGASPSPACGSSMAGPSRRTGAEKTFGPKDDPHRYVLGPEIGEGATAKVHKCFRGEDVYAVKTISLAKLRLQRDFERISDKLHREVSILFALRHQRIVTLFDVVEETDVALHLVMELVEGGELFDRIAAHGCFSEVVARYVFLQIVEGLRYIHSKDIVHRDLKPENILVDERACKGSLLEVKLSDFGHSKLINDGYSTALTRVGTPQYWAPEVSDPRKAAQGYDQTVDLWSLGVVLYVMLVGAYPFDGLGASIDAQMKQVQLTFGGKRELSDQAKDLIYALMKPNPRERLALDKCMQHPWVTMAGGTMNKLMKLCTEVNPNATEVRIPLPWRPVGDQVQKLRNDLVKWQTRHRFSARLMHQEVIVNFAEAESRSGKGGRGRSGGYKCPVPSTQNVQGAEAELQALIDYHAREAAHAAEAAPVVPAAPAPPTVSGGSSGSGGGAQRSFRLLSHNLRVTEDGAGLELIPEQGGMRITEVFDTPGQPGLQKGDLITKINEVSLHGSRAEEIFRRHFGNGALLAVRRQR